MNQTQHAPTPAPAHAAWLIPLGFLVLLLPGIRTISHADFWVHLASGQAGFSRVDPLTRLAEGTTWINPNWLYDLLLARLWSLGGAGLITLLHVLAVGLAFYLLVRIMRPQASPVSIALSLCMAGWLLAPQFLVHPGVLSLLFAAVTVFVLSSSAITWRTYAALLPLQIVWANMHGSFLWGPLMALLFGLQAYFDAPANQRTAASLLPGAGLSLALLLVCLLNPYGPSLFAALLPQFLRALSSDWISPVSHLFPSPLARHTITVALVVGAGGLLTCKQRLPLGFTALAMLGAFLAVRSMTAGIHWLALLAFPFFCLSFDALGERLSQRASPAMERGGTVALAAVVIAIAFLSSVMLLSNRYYLSTGSFSEFGLGVDETPFPRAAVPLLQDAEFPARFINTPMDGGFLAYALGSNRAFIDNRVELHGNDALALLAAALGGQTDAWDRLVLDQDPDAVILNNLWVGAPEAARFIRQLPDWESLYFDGVTTILIRDISRYPQLAAQRDSIAQAGQITLENHRRSVRQQMQGTRRPPLSAPLLGAAQIYMANNQFRQAAACYALLHAQSPGMRSAQLNLGICHRHLGNHQDAVRLLSQAVATAPRNSTEWLTAHLNLGISQLGLREPAQAVRHLRIVNEAAPNNIWSWLYLSRAYTQLGQATDARQALERARSLNPTLTEQFIRDGQ